jgi:uncharacterized paraquat-inducible protein A
MEEPTYQYDFEPLSVDEVIQYKTYQMKEQMKVLEDSNVFCFSVYKMDLDDEVIYDSENEYETLKKTLCSRCNKFNLDQSYKTCPSCRKKSRKYKKEYSVKRKD